VNGRAIDNKWVVPYNPYLCLKYNCHINVKVCASVKSAKYFFKYVYKGHDSANVQIQQHGTLQHDEIKAYMDSRYVSAPEAAWKNFGFNMHEQSHTIIRLPVHLPDEQSVSFHPDNVEEAVDRASTRETMLTAWLKLNKDDRTATEYLYPEIPQHFVFD